MQLQICHALVISVVVWAQSTLWPDTPCTHYALWFPMSCSSDIVGMPISKTFIHFSEKAPAVRRSRSWSPPRACRASSTVELGGARNVQSSSAAAVPSETDLAPAPVPRPLPMEKGTWNRLCDELRTLNAVLLPMPARGYIQNKPGFKHAPGYLKAAPASLRSWWISYFHGSCDGERPARAVPMSSTEKKKKNKVRRAAETTMPSNPTDIHCLDEIIRDHNGLLHLVGGARRWARKRVNRTETPYRRLAAGQGSAEAEPGSNFADILRGAGTVVTAAQPRPDRGTCALNASAACDEDWAEICPTWRERKPLSPGYFNRLAAEVCARRGLARAPMWEFERRQRWANLLRSGEYRMCVVPSPTGNEAGHAFVIHFPRSRFRHEVEVLDDSELDEVACLSMTRTAQCMEEFGQAIFFALRAQDVDADAGRQARSDGPRGMLAAGSV